MTYGTKLTSNIRTLAIAAGASVLLAGPGLAADLGTYKGMAEPDPVPARQLELSANVALTTDYVFRGQSQSDENAAIQGGFDAAHGIFYVGVWASSLDFGASTVGATPGDIADIEIDWYGGITPKLGRFDLDFGVIYYSYPNAFDAPGGELNFWEFKAGWSYTVLKDLGVSTTIFYSPDYTGEIGNNVVLETSLEKPIGHGFSLSGTLGTQWGDNSKGGDDYHYWNVGVSKEFHDKFTLDLRYWDTSGISGGCSDSGRPVFQCDARFVGTLSASF